MLQLKTHYDPETKIWSGPRQKLFFNPKLTLGEAVRICLQSKPMKIGQITDYNGVHLTNREILLRSLKIAHYLKRFNLQMDDVVGVIARNTENLAPLIFGILYNGLVINTLDVSFTEYEIMNLFRYSKPKIVFCDVEEYEKVKKVLDLLGNNAVVFTVCRGLDSIISVEQLLKQTTVEDAHSFIPSDPEDGRNHGAIILCSSGTTGPSKGIILSHASILRTLPFENLTDNAVMLCLNSLYWFSGLITLFGATISGITRLVTNETFKPDLMLRLIEQHKVTRILSPSSLLALLVDFPDCGKYDLSSLQEYGCGGGHVPPEMCQKFRKSFVNCNVVIFYGMTEAGGVCSVNLNPDKNKSVGHLWPNTQMKIINKEGNAEGPNNRGEICIKSPFNFIGYCGPLEDTGNAVVESDGWIHSGDIGYFDDNGLLYIVDRIKHILKYRCCPVAPSEIENYLLTLPGVSQVCVCGVPDEEVGDLPAALIVRKTGSLIREDKINQQMKDHFSDYKLLRGGIYFVDSLPMTPSGKCKKGEAQNIVIELYKKCTTNGRI